MIPFQGILLAVSGAAIIGGVALIYHGAKSEAYKNGHNEAVQQMQVSLDAIRQRRDKKEAELRLRISKLDRAAASARQEQDLWNQSMRSVASDYRRTSPVANDECLDLVGVRTFNSFTSAGRTTPATPPSSFNPDTMSASTESLGNEAGDEG